MTKPEQLKSLRAALYILVMRPNHENYDEALREIDLFVSDLIVKNVRKKELAKRRAA